MLQWLQKYPHFLEIVYDLTEFEFASLQALAETGEPNGKTLYRHREGWKGSGFQLQDVRSMCLAQHRDDLPDELPQTSAQWTLWWCAPEWQL